jgi:hypothetical protein
MENKTDLTIITKNSSNILSNTSPTSSSTSSQQTTNTLSPNTTKKSVVTEASNSLQVTKPISALDKATFPFPCYLEMVMNIFFFSLRCIAISREKIVQIEIS